MRIRPNHDTALLRLRPDIHAALLGVAGGEIESPIWGKVTVDDAVQYKPTAKPNNIRFGEVVAMGKGSPIGSGLDIPACKRGDIVCVDGCQIGHIMPDGTHQVLFRDIICRLDDGETLPTPLTAWVMTTPDDVLYRRFLDIKADWLVLPPSARSAIGSSGIAGSRINLTCRKVVAAGKGELVNAHSARRRAFWEVECKTGHGAIFMPSNGVTLQLTGHNLRFVRWSDIEACLVPDDDED